MSDDAVNSPSDLEKLIRGFLSRLEEITEPEKDKFELYLKFADLTNRSHLIIDLTTLLAKRPFFFREVSLEEMQKSFEYLRKASIELANMTLLLGPKSEALEEVDINLSGIDKKYIA